MASRTWTALSRTAASEVARLGVIKEWAHQVLIFQQGQPCAGLHILQSGMVKLFIASRAGREQTLRVQSEPGPLTLLPLFDGQPYAQNASALGRARTTFLSAHDAQWLTRTHSEFAAAVQAEYARHMRTLISVIDSVALRPVAARIAHYLEGRVAEQDAWAERAWFEIPLNQDELALLVGTTRESVARALRSLERARIIERRRAKVRVCDPAALEKCSETGLTLLEQ